MEFTLRHQRQITNWLFVLYLILLVDRWWNGIFLYQMQPSFINTRMDVFTWFFMYTGLHKSLLNNHMGWLILDCVFMLLPLACFMLFRLKSKWSGVISWLWVIFNWIYIQCYTLYPTNSIEAHLAWLLLPVLFTCTTLRGFYLSYHFFRYFFLWFMVSAGLWKIWQQGFFNYEEMSAIILMQHKEFLASSIGNWFSDLSFWLLRNQGVGYILYVSSAIIELLFVTGFFTRRFDRWLIVLYILFFIMDVLLMRIKYWEMAPFIVTLCYSVYTLPYMARTKPIIVHR